MTFLSRFPVCPLALLLLAVPALAVRGKGVAEAEDRPEAVLVSAENPKAGRAALCCGVLVAPRVVVTAAHCVDGFTRFRVTAPYRDGGPKTATSRDARVYPAYAKGDRDEDLAVIVLDEPLADPDDVPKLYRGDLLRLETPLLVVGRVRDGKPSEEKLYQVPVTLVDYPGNINLYGAFPQTLERGDSGGPVYVRGEPRYLVGINIRVLGWSQANVEKGGLLPIDRVRGGWIRKQFPE